MQRRDAVLVALAGFTLVGCGLSRRPREQPPSVTTTSDASEPDAAATGNPAPASSVASSDGPSTPTDGIALHRIARHNDRLRLVSLDGGDVAVVARRVGEVVSIHCAPAAPCEAAPPRMRAGPPGGERRVLAYVGGTWPAVEAVVENVDSLARFQYRESGWQAVGASRQATPGGQIVEWQGRLLALGFSPKRLAPGAPQPLWVFAGAGWAPANALGRLGVERFFPASERLYVAIGDGFDRPARVLGVAADGRREAVSLPVSDGCTLYSAAPTEIGDGERIWNAQERCDGRFRAFLVVEGTPEGSHRIELSEAALHVAEDVDGTLLLSTQRRLLRVTGTRVSEVTLHGVDAGDELRAVRVLAAPDVLLVTYSPRTEGGSLLRSRPDPEIALPGAVEPDPISH
jgi:hypothetical protein